MTDHWYKLPPCWLRAMAGTPYEYLVVCAAPRPTEHVETIVNSDRSVALHLQVELLDVPGWVRSCAYPHLFPGVR